MPAERLAHAAAVFSDMRRLPQLLQVPPSVRSGP